MWILWVIIGAIMGSFTNMLIWRIPRHENWVTKRSYCPNCGHVLGPLDLIPVLSYIMLGGKCRYCKQPISSRYVIVEIISAGLWGLVPFIYTLTNLQTTIAYTVFIFFSLLISGIDWYYKEIHSALLYIPLLIIGILMYQNWFSALVYSCIFGAVYLFSLIIFKQPGLGDGDIIYAAICGFMCNDLTKIGIFLLICGVFGIVSALLYARNTGSKLRHLELPFLPSMFFGALIVFSLVL